MSLPKFPGKYEHPATFSAGDLIARRGGSDGQRVPERMIINFQDHLFRYAVRKYRSRSIKSPFGEVARLRVSDGKGEIGITGRFGIGAPVAVFVLEWLAALGARQFLAVGYAGGLLERQDPGDLVVCSAALRDEGTSYHYQPPADYSHPDKQLSLQLEAAFKNLGYAHETGPTWTTDAPFRETFPEVEHFRNQGILTVEMEAAALFAASSYLGTACAAAFTISDAPRDGRWGIDFDRATRTAGLEKLADAAIEAFL